MTEEARRAGKSQRKRLQRQLEFYLSESNLRQDKFLQQAMDEQGFVPVHIFLSFNKLKSLNATERMILDEADKSSVIRVDRTRSCIAPKFVPPVGQDHEIDVRTLYIDSFITTDDHDSLRQTFAKFGKVNLVSLPRFPQSKNFKGFGFVEFSERSAADKVAANPSDPDLRGIRVMSKTRWLDMKEQLKRRLSYADADVANGNASDKINSAHVPDDSNTFDLENSKAVTGKKKKKRRKPAAGSHIRLGDNGEGEVGLIGSDSNDNQEGPKKPRV